MKFQKLRQLMKSVIAMSDQHMATDRIADEAGAPNVQNFLSPDAVDSWAKRWKTALPSSQIIRAYREQERSD
jgi:hypothetical protein